ncbi:hypothetical protein GCM10009574_000840 [Streptomyces asiaticus]|uniref:Uncharacterized protein n=2 Tax=Streptomyces rhizosphaericus TaxID=114699 RepID=A0ABP4A7S8_9ACTN
MALAAHGVGADQGRGDGAGVVGPGDPDRCLGIGLVPRLDAQDAEGQQHQVDVALGEDLAQGHLVGLGGERVEGHRKGVGTEVPQLPRGRLQGG